MRKDTKDWLRKPALVTWVEKECPQLGEDIKIHIEELTDLDADGKEGLWRCIMVSIRQNV